MKNEDIKAMIICSPVKYLESNIGSWYACNDCGTKVFCSDASVNTIKKQYAVEFPDMKDEEIAKYCGKCGIAKVNTLNEPDLIADPSDEQIQLIATHFKISFEEAKKMALELMKDIRSGKIKPESLQ